MNGSASPRLSVCVITKNEALNLPRLLASVEGVADELIVTDTGSTDDTVAIANRAGALVDHFDWVDDFSAAYNHCIARATGEWVLLLDADEELHFESHAEVRRAICTDDALCFTVLRQELIQADRLDVYSEMLQTRLFRPLDEVRFVGKIHHLFTPPIVDVAAQRGLRLYTSQIRLRHYCFAAKNLQQKLKRDARLMELELKERPGQFYYLVELGRTRLALKDDTGVELLRQAAQQVATDFSKVTNTAPLVLLLEHLLACDVLPKDFPLTSSDVEKLAARYTATIPLLWQRALKQFKHGQFARCAELLERIRGLARDHSYDPFASFDPDIMGRDAMLNLAVCYTRLGKLDKAKKHFEQLKDDPKHGASARANYHAICNL